MIAAISRSGKFSVKANSVPANSIKAAPIMSIRLLPKRSAVVVMISEITASPISVRLSSTPMTASLKPNWER
jgi:hypothetical protein